MRGGPRIARGGAAALTGRACRLCPRRRTGFRGDGGYGLVAYGLEDAEAAGRYDAARFNYREGFEDTDFLLRLVRLPRLLVRRKEAGMIHRYHARAAWKDEANEGPLRDQPLPRVC